MAGRVLIAEDNAALQTVIEFTVAKAGFDVVVTPNGRKALQTACESTFDIVISDQQMPHMTGIEFCRELRNHSDYKDTPFILLTAKRLELDVEGLKNELRISEVLPKPFSPGRLSELLHDLAVGVA